MVLIDWITCCDWRDAFLLGCRFLIRYCIPTQIGQVDLLSNGKPKVKHNSQVANQFRRTQDHPAHRRFVDGVPSICSGIVLLGAA